jgi:hypothetical protein
VLANSYTYQWVKRIIHFHARRFEEAASVAEAMAAPVPNAMLYTRIPQMDWRSASAVHQFQLLAQGLKLDQVAES